MRISTEELEHHLARELAPLYTVFGEELLLAIEAADRIRARARDAGYRERELISAEGGFRWSELAFAAASRSLFSARRLLELRIPNGRPGSEGAEALARYCRTLPPETITLVALPALDWRAQKTAWFEALERAGTVVEARRVARGALPDWLAGRLRAQQQEADRETLEFIAERVEGNLIAAHQEVRKLALLFPPGRLPPEAARAAVLDVTRHDLGDLAQRLLEGDALRIARALDGLRAEGVAPPLVLWALAEQARAIARVLDALGRGFKPPRLWQEARIGNRRQQALLQQHWPRFSRPQLEAALEHAARADRVVKGLARGEAWDELLGLALRFAAAAPGAPEKRGRMGRARPDQPRLL